MKLKPNIEMEWKRLVETFAAVSANLSVFLNNKSQKIELDGEFEKHINVKDGAHLSGAVVHERHQNFSGAVSRNLQYPTLLYKKFYL